MISDIFGINAGHGQDDDQNRRWGPEVQIVPHTPERPNEDERRREIENAIIRQRILDDIANGRDPLRRQPEKKPTIYHAPDDDSAPRYIM